MNNKIHLKAVSLELTVKHLCKRQHTTIQVPDLQIGTWILTFAFEIEVDQNIENTFYVNTLEAAHSTMVTASSFPAERVKLSRR